MSVLDELRADPVLHWVRQGVLGRDAVIRTPFGALPKRYFDYTASGLPFSPIEDVVRTSVLPWMANTHTDASAVGGYMTELYEDAHRKIARHVRADDEDVVVFCGNGATAAINKLVRAIGLTVPEPVERVHPVKAKMADADRPLVVLSRMEHISNDLPWRESIAEVVLIGFDEKGRVSADELDRVLSEPKYAKHALKIGAFSAASNVTGIINDVDALARIMHKHGGYACFDYAAAAPYVDIDMHPQGDPSLRKDAVFISMHKFLGGPQAPGLLVANKALFRSSVPVEPGGGTVVYHSPWDWRYTDNLAHREEGGTPNIVGAIRGGLAVELKETIGTARIKRVEEALLAHALARLQKNNKIAVLGDPSVPRLGILSLIFDEGRLHYNLAARMLSDRWGIQTRGGAMCAGAYGAALMEGLQGFNFCGDVDQLGWVRVSFSPATTEEEIAVLLDALESVAERWQQWAGDYRMDERTQTWRHIRDGIDPSTRNRPPRLLPPGM